MRRIFLFCFVAALFVLGAAPYEPRKVSIPLVYSEWSPPPTATPTATATATATLTPTSTVTPTSTPPAPANCYIGHLSYSGAEEYVRVANGAGAAQDMTSWRIQSVVGNQWYTFPSGYRLAAGASVYVTTGPSARSSPPDYLRWTTLYIWNNNGDEARLYNAGGIEVDRWKY